MQIETLENLRWKDWERTETPAEISLALGSAYFRTGQAGDAEREYLAALKARPRLGEAHDNLAVLYMLSGHLEDAAQHLKDAEKAGFRVNPGLKKELEQKLQQR